MQRHVPLVPLHVAGADQAGGQLAHGRPLELPVVRVALGRVLGQLAVGAWAEKSTKTGRNPPNTMCEMIMISAQGRMPMAMK